MIMKKLLKKFNMKQVNTKKKKYKANSGKVHTLDFLMTILSLIITLYSALNKNLPESLASDVNPGTHKAILTLASGKQINLAEAKSGSLLKLDGIEITKTEDETLVYKETDSKSNASASHTITTPRGGQYKIILSDGTKIWLNAASSLSYAVSLDEGGETRNVKMSGEAYFEVKEDKTRPFVVLADRQKLEVFGTHFNISAYPDERSIKTTLFEGSVRISAFLPINNCRALQKKQVFLKPNQQSTLTKNSLQIADVDIEEAVAWKNGFFSAGEEPLESVMLQISRWYDVDVVYEDKQIAQQVHGGVMFRSEKLLNVLNALKISGNVNFKVEGRKVTVMK